MCEYHMACCDQSRKIFWVATAAQIFFTPLKLDCFFLFVCLLFLLFFFWGGRCFEPTKQGSGATAPKAVTLWRISMIGIGYIDKI